MTCDICAMEVEGAYKVFGRLACQRCLDVLNGASVTQAEKDEET